MEAKLVKYIDPRLNLETTKQFATSQGASFVSTQAFRGNGTLGNAINIACNPPNRNIVIARGSITKNAVLNVRITGTSGTGATTKFILKKGSHAPAYHPLTAITNTESLGIGNDEIVVQETSEVHRALSRYDKDCYYETTPTMNDTYQTFDEVKSSIRSALSEYFDQQNGYDNLVSRRGFSDYDTVANNAVFETKHGNDGDPVDINFDFKVSEPIYMSPLVFGENAENAEGLYGIETMKYVATLNDLNRAFSYNLSELVDGFQNGTVSVVVSLKDFFIQVQYLTPQVNANIPRNALYPYYQPNFRSAQKFTLTGGATSASQQISWQLSGIPRRVYMFARITKATLASAVGGVSVLPSGASPNRHLCIADLPNCRVLINNNPNFQGYTKVQIYQMCKRNGLNLNYTQWDKHAGSVVCLDFSKGDIALMPEQASGVSQKNTLDFQCSFKNTTDQEIEAEFCVVAVYDGLLRMEDGNVSHVVNPLTESMIVGTQPNKNLHLDHKPDDVYGGGLHSGLRSMKGTATHSSMPSGGGLENAPQQGGRMMSRAMLRNRY